MALRELDVVLTKKDTDGTTIIQMPITRVDNVEGAIKTINGSAPDSAGNVSVTTSSIKALPLTGGTLSGTLQCQSSIVGSKTGVGSLTMFSGANNFDGATIQLFERSNPSYAGKFYIRTSTKSSAGDSTSGVASYDLVGAPNGSLTWGGTMYAGAFQISSDRRLKSNVKSIESALDKVAALVGCTYDMTTLKGRQAGLIAQDVEKVLPEAVSENEDGYKTINYGAITALLVNAINEIRERLNDIELS